MEYTNKIGILVARNIGMTVCPSCRAGTEQSHLVTMSSVTDARLFS